jgi:hypothetical protein
MVQDTRLRLRNPGGPEVEGPDEVIALERRNAKGGDPGDARRKFVGS